MQREQGKEKERKKRCKRKYGQAKLKHAKRGIVSCVISAIVLVLLIGMLGKAYVSRGTSAPLIGGVGLIAMLLASCGLYMGVRGFREREKDYLTCKIGAGCNAIFVLGFILIFCRGLF